MYYGAVFSPTTITRRRRSFRRNPQSNSLPVTRLGLFYTAEELVIWRNRAVSGPYKIQATPQHGGPGTTTGAGKGDWERVVYYRDRLMNNVVFQGLTMQAYQSTSTTFSTGYPNNPDRSKPVPNTTDYESNGTTLDPSRYDKEPKQEGIALTASAFYALVMKTINPTDADAVAQVCKPILLAQVTNAGTLFPNVNTNNTKWHDGLSDTSCWTFTEFMTRYVFAYDYLRNYVLEGGSALFSSSEKTTMLQWFEKYANLMARNIHNDMGAVFSNRKTGDLVTPGYRIVNADQTSGNKWTHCNGDGSPGNLIGGASNFINNRRANQNLIIGLIDLSLKQAGYTSSTVNIGGTFQTLEFCAKLHYKECMIIGYFEDGSSAEAERLSEPDPLKGYHYTWDTLGYNVLLSAAYLRAGDGELVNYSTNRGYYYTHQINIPADPEVGPPATNVFELTTGGIKSIFTALDWHVSNVVETDPNKFRYVKTATAQYIDADHRLWHKDGLFEYVREARALPLTHFWKSAKLNAATTRTYQTNRIGDAAGLQDWWGQGEIMPYHFMFAQMGNAVYPYPATKLFA